MKKKIHLSVYLYHLHMYTNEIGNICSLHFTSASQILNIPPQRIIHF